MKQYLTIVLLLIFAINSYGQVAGNQIYQANNHNRGQSTPPVKRNNIVSTDSTLIVTATVLLNKEADYYLMTIGVKEEAKTVIECNENINSRIDLFFADLALLGIKQEDLYTDFISQTKIYDHSVEGNIIEEYFEGFEIRKSLIVKLKKLDAIDEIIDLASKQEIHDIVKVEYFNDDLEKIYDELFNETIKVIDSRKSRFSKYSSARVSENYRIVHDNFGVYHPKNMYKKYDEAFESSTVNTHYSGSYIKKEVRKDKTFYYEGAQNNLAFDKVLDEISPVIGIQYSLQLNVIYELER